MNGLSSRVSSIKMSENVKKNSEIQISIIKVTDSCLNSFGGQSVHESAAYSCVSQFIDATSIEQQLSSVKNLLPLLEIGTSSAELCKHIVEFLSECYFGAPLRHPVRNLVARNFDKMANHQAIIVECLAQTAIKSCTRIDDSSSVNELNELITSLEGYSDNFHIGILSLYQCFDEVFRLLSTSIAKYLMEIEKPNSPANLSEIFIFLHGAVRLSLWYVQRCVYDRSLKKTNELAELAKFCKIIINCAAVPMDTKLNCGIFLVLNEIIRDNLLELSGHLATIDGDAKSTERNVDTLCFCYGLCNTLPSSDIFHARGSFLIRIIEILRTIADKHSNEQTMLLGACRALVQMTKSFLTLHMVPASEMDQIDPIELVSHCLSFVWSYFEHHLDTVRHFCKDIYRNLLKLSQRHEGHYTFILTTVLTTVKNQEISRNAQYVAVEHLSQEMPVEDIIDAWPNIFDDLFNNLNDPKCLSCYQKMMSIHCKEIDVQSWFQIWIRPLLCDTAVNVDLPTKECLVNVAIKTHPMVPSYFLYEKEKLPLELYLFVVSTIRRNGLPLGKHFVPAEDELICGAKFHINDDIRIMHLRIFIEVQKTTRPFTADDLNEILAFLYYNSNCQSPAFRQKINAFMTKAFNRFEVSYPSVFKDALKTTTHTAYIEFLDKVKQLCLSNIYNGANFSRRSISLNLLLQTMTVAAKNNKISAEILWTTEAFEKIVQSLGDTYEANKSLAVDVIRLCPKELVPRSEKFDLQHLKSLTTSVKPMDCVTAAYSLDYCCITGINFSSYFEATTWCNDILIDGLKTAQSSLLIAARSNPLYGLVFCIRHLMSRVDLRKTYEPRWRDFVKQLIELCKKLTEVVGPIVNSSSPEGHLPNDHGNISNFLPNEVDSFASGPPNKILSTRSQHDNNDCLATTPQMLLLCSWRTVKEVSLLLGDLALNSSILNDSKQGVITIDEILEIGNHFHVLLSETKHRGAFEQAFVGFSKLCVRLWRSQELRLHQMPMVWLKDLLNIISGNDSSTVTDLKFDKICATRRSAGVPFMVQAILTSELQVCTTNGLKYSMVTLFEICENGSAAAEARTHALNILRALFRCTDLGDSIGEYISDGIECAIRGYSSENWPERNSSTLLFSSLITRVFGVQRTKDSENLNIRNKMTGRIFFMKYPHLFDFFMQELQSATRSIQRDEVPPTLHPLLILLSRLYPSAVDGCASNLKLSLLLPFIAQCTHSPELKTRKLAVKSIVALVPQYDLYNYVNGVVEQLLENDAPMNSNAIHGSLLQIYHLIKSMEKKLFAKHFDDFVSLTKMYLNLNVLTSNNFVLVKVYGDSVIEILRRIGSSKVSETDLNTSLIHITAFLPTVLHEHHNSINSIGFPLALKSCLVLHSMINIHQIHQLNFLENLSQRPYEYVDAALNIMLLVLNNTCPDDIVDRFECERNERQFLDYLTIEQHEELRNSIIGAEQLISELNRIIDDVTTFYPFCTVKAYTVLSDLNLHTVSENDLIDLIEMRTAGQIDEVKASIVKYAGNHLSKFFDTMSEANVMRILTKMREMASPDGSDELRCSISLVVSKIRRTWSTATSVLLFGDIVLLLLRDECADIRETMSQFVQWIQCEHSSCTAAVIPSLAEEHFIEWLDERIRLLSSDQPWTLWMQLIEKQLERKTTLEREDVIDEVFDRSESNVFGEVLVVCKKLMGKFRQSLAESGSDDKDVEVILQSVESDWPELCHRGGSYEFK